MMKMKYHDMLKELSTRAAVWKLLTVEQNRKNDKLALDKEILSPQMLDLTA